MGQRCADDTRSVCGDGAGFSTFLYFEFRSGIMAVCTLMSTALLPTHRLNFFLIDFSRIVYALVRAGMLVLCHMAFRNA